MIFDEPCRCCGGPITKRQGQERLYAFCSAPACRRAASTARQRATRARRRFNVADPSLLDGLSEEELWRQVCLTEADLAALKFSG